MSPAMQTARSSFLKQHISDSPRRSRPAFSATI